MESTDRTIIAAVALFVLTGCGPTTATSPQQPPRAPASESRTEQPSESQSSGNVRTIGLLKSETEGLTSGISTGAIFTWDGNPALFLFSDSNSCTTVRSDAPTLLRFEGALEYEQMEFPFVAELQSARQGSLTIGGEKYELANGTLVLVSGSGGKIRTRQLDRDLSSVDLKERATWAAFLKGDPEIPAFFKDSDVK